MTVFTILVCVALIAGVYFTIRSNSDFTVKGIARRALLSVLYIYLGFAQVVAMFCAGVLRAKAPVHTNLGKTLDAIEVELNRTEVY